MSAGATVYLSVNNRVPSAGDSKVSGPSHGTLTLNTDGSFSYTPTTYYNGTDSFTYRVNDGYNDSNTATMNLTINARNSAPVFTKGSDDTVNEEAGLVTRTGWATGISPGGGSDKASQTLAFNISNNNNALFSQQPGIDLNGNLTYRAAANAHGAATISVYLHDSSGISNGGQDNSATQTFLITVNSVNDQPSFTRGSDENINEDISLVSVSGWASVIATLSAHVDLPAGGIVFIDGESEIGTGALQAGQTAHGATAVLQARYPTSGSHTIHARFAGAEHFRSSLSSPVEVQVGSRPLASLSGILKTAFSSRLITYTLTITNPDPLYPQNNVEITSTLPVEVDVIAIANGAVITSTPGSGYVYSGFIPRLQPGQQTILTWTVRNRALIGNFLTHAYAWSDSSILDMANNTGGPYRLGFIAKCTVSCPARNLAQAAGPAALIPGS
jgi:VCBS repeat-containing protein